MNIEQWLMKIEEMRASGSEFLHLSWDGDEWERWNFGNFTPDQAAMIAACNELGVTPYPGERDVDTISFR